MDKQYSLLIIDDEKDIVDQLYDYFRRDYNVLKAYGCNEAIELLKDNDVNLVMTDQRMPNMQGTEFLAKCKVEMPEVTRILMTGYTDLEVAIEAINQGSIHRYLSKPLNFEELEGIIQEGIQQYEEAVKVKNLISQEKDDIIGKIKGVFSHLKNIEMDKGKLEEEIQAAKDVENRIYKEMEEQIAVLEGEKSSTKQKVTELEGKIGKMMEELEEAQKDSNKVKQMAEENKKVQESMKELEARFAVVNKSALSLKSDIEKVKQELETAKAEKNRIEKKLKQFQANWGKAMAA